MIYGHELLWKQNSCKHAEACQRSSAGGASHLHTHTDVNTTAVDDARVRGAVDEARQRLGITSSRFFTRNT